MIKAYPDSKRNAEYIQICNILDLAYDKVCNIKGNLQSILEKSNSIEN